MKTPSGDDSASVTCLAGATPREGARDRVCLLQRPSPLSSPTPRGLEQPKQGPQSWWLGDECPLGLRRNLGFTQSGPNSALLSRCNYCFKQRNLKNKTKQNQTLKELQVPEKSLKDELVIGCRFLGQAAIEKHYWPSQAAHSLPSEPP